MTRLVYGNLSKSLCETNNAIKKYKSSEELMVFENAIRNGVNANLCDALIGLSGVDKDFDLEISIELSPLEEDRQGIVKTHRLLSSNVGILKIASNFYKGDFSINKYRAIGFVSKLSHDAGGPYGIITVKSIVNGCTRSINITLEIGSYRKAVDAHQSEKKVACYGVLRVTPKSAVLEQVYTFEVL